MTASGCAPPKASWTTHERAALVERTHSHGGRVSWATRPDGSRTVYELNLSYLDALCTVDEAADPAVLAAKTLAAHSILFDLPRRPRRSTTTPWSARHPTSRAW